VSTYDVPLVGGLVDEVVGVAEDNPLYGLPLIGGLLQQAVKLVLDTAAIFAVALVLGAALFYTWPSVAAIFPHWLGTLSGFWAYVVLILALRAALLVLESVVAGDVADVLRKDTRDAALDALSKPAMLILLVWLITTYIS